MQPQCPRSVAAHGLSRQTQTPVQNKQSCQSAAASLCVCAPIDRDFLMHIRCSRTTASRSFHRRVSVGSASSWSSDAVVRPRTCADRRSAFANDRCRHRWPFPRRGRKSSSNVDRSFAGKTAAGCNGSRAPVEVEEQRSLKWLKGLAGTRCQFERLQCFESSRCFCTRPELRPASRWLTAAARLLRSTGRNRCIAVVRCRVSASGESRSTDLEGARVVRFGSRNQTRIRAAGRTEFFSGIRRARCQRLVF